VSAAGARAAMGEKTAVGEAAAAAAIVAGDLRALCDVLAAWVDEPPARPPSWLAARAEEFRDAARVHGVAPLLAGQIAARAAREEWGAWRATAVGAWLADQHEMSRRRSERLRADLRAVLAAFAGGGVPVMPLKGMALAALYADPAARPMADLDLLVRAADLESGIAILGGLGYEPVFAGRKHVKLARPSDREVLDEGCEHPDNPRPIELHPACGEWLDEERVELSSLLWAAARPGELAGAPCWLPDAAAHWLYLLVHASHHLLINRFRLLQLLDLRLLGPAALGGGAAAQLLAECERDGGNGGGALARAAYAPLALLDRYDPSPARRAERAPLRQALGLRLPRGFVAWADGLDLYEVSYLHAAPWRAE
jgi:hypothetical protein